MTQHGPLNLVVSYDRNRNEYSLSAHNRTSEEARSLVAEGELHLGPGCSFLVVAQSRRHRSEDLNHCRACRETVARAAHLEPQPKFVRST